MTTDTSPTTTLVGRLFAPAFASELPMLVVRCLSGLLGAGVAYAVILWSPRWDPRLCLAIGAGLQALVAVLADWWSCRWRSTSVTVRLREGRLFLKRKRLWRAARESAVQLVAGEQLESRWRLAIVLAETSRPAVVELLSPPWPAVAAEPLVPADMRMRARAVAFSPSKAALRLAPLLGPIVWAAVVPRPNYEGLCLVPPLLLWIAVWGLFDFSGAWTLSTTPVGLAFGSRDGASWDQDVRVDALGKTMVVYWSRENGTTGERTIDFAGTGLRSDLASWFLSKLVEACRLPRHDAAPVRESRAAARRREARRKTEEE